MQQLVFFQEDVLLWQSQSMTLRMCELTASMLTKFKCSLLWMQWHIIRVKSAAWDRLSIIYLTNRLRIYCTPSSGSPEGPNGFTIWVTPAVAAHCMTILQYVCIYIYTHIYLRFKQSARYETQELPADRLFNSSDWVDFEIDSEVVEDAEFTVRKVTEIELGMLDHLFKTAYTDCSFKQSLTSNASQVSLYKRWSDV